MSCFSPGNLLHIVRDVIVALSYLCFHPVLGHLWSQNRETIHKKTDGQNRGWINNKN